MNKKMNKKSSFVRDTLQLIYDSSCMLTKQHYDYVINKKLIKNKKLLSLT